MPMVSVSCPSCEKETQINLPMLEIGKHTRTYACQNCRKSIIVEVAIKAPPGASLHKNREWLEQKYSSEGKTMQELADICGVTPMTIRDWLNRHEIPVRSRGARV